MVERISSEIHRNTDQDVTNIKYAILDAIQEWKVYRLGFNVRKWSFTTTVDEDEYKFPVADADSEFIVPIEIDSCRVLINNFWHPLIPTNFDVFQSEYNIRNFNDSGYPCVYTVGPYDVSSPAGRVFMIDPDPNDEYTIEGYGLCDINEIDVDSSDEATNDWFTKAEILIRTQAKINLFTNNYQSQQDVTLLIPQLFRAKDFLSRAVMKLDNTNPVPWY